MPRSIVLIPMNPIVHDRAMWVVVYTRPRIDMARECVSVSEPSLLPWITWAVTCPCGVLATPVERCQHVLGSVAVLEAGKDHEVLRRIDFARHGRIIRRFRKMADLAGHYGDDTPRDPANGSGMRFLIRGPVGYSAGYFLCPEGVNDQIEL